MEGEGDAGLFLEGLGNGLALVLVDPAVEDHARGVPSAAAGDGQAEGPHQDEDSDRGAHALPPDTVSLR